MRKSIVQALMILLVATTAVAYQLEALHMETTPDGSSRTSLITQSREDSGEILLTPIASYAPGILWHYSVASGVTQKVTTLGENAEYVFTGGWYSGARMFLGVGGSGDPDWETPEPEAGPNEYWTSWEAGTAAAEYGDLFYSVFNWLVYNDNGTPGVPGDDWLVSSNTEVARYSASSSAPVWSWEGTGTFRAASVDTPGRFDVSSDGSVLAVGGSIDGHLAVEFFAPDDSQPFMTYENPSQPYSPRQLRLTADGSVCIFRVAAKMYRVDTATGELVSTYALDASTDCFGVSPDGSVVAYGFTSARVAVWDGTSYSLAWTMPATGFFAGCAAVAADNTTIYFGFYRNTYLENRIYRYDVSSPVPLWAYSYPTGSGGYQDIPEWMDCSDDGRWLAVGSWGCASGGGPEVEVFDDLDPVSPAYVIDTPGSMFCVDISPDGSFLTAAGKHVHANQMGSGTDIYLAQLFETGVHGDPVMPPVPELHSVYPNPSSSTTTFTFALPSGGPASLCLMDVCGRTVVTEELGCMESGENSATLNLNLPSGLYLCRISACGSSVNGRLLMVD